MNTVKVGFAICGSFCTFSRAIAQMKTLKEKGYDVFPIMSEISYNTDTRFGKASDFIEQIQSICGRSIIHTIVDAEPIGPQKMFDILIIAPCTGNTLGKLACGITDTSVTMAAKAHLRNELPLLIAVSSNDALSNSAKNIGILLNNKNIYFVPMGEDDIIKKSRSIVADFERIEQSINYALKGIQIQPILI